MINKVKIISEIDDDASLILELSKDITEKQNKLNEQIKVAEKRQDAILRNTLSCNEICSLLGITRPTLIKRRKQGLIPYIRLGINFRYFDPSNSGEVCHG